MSIPVLAQAATELRRVAIAGAPLARGDFRIQRLVEPLRATGQRAPVFATVADLLDGLTTADADTAAPQLLKTITLVNAILYTQGQTGVGGELEDLPPSHIAISETTVSARRLLPVLEALSTTGSGRWEIVTRAHADGLFTDPRLIRPAVAALGDPFAELADFVADKILPDMGEMIVPLLEDGLDLQGDRSHRRRLQVLARLKGEAAWDLLMQALDEGQAAMRVAAVECLATMPAAAPVLKDLTQDRNGDVRQAALAALSHQDDGDAIGLLLAAIQGKDFRRAMDPARRCRAPEFVAGLLQEFHTRLEALLAAPQADEALYERVSCLLQCIADHDDADSLAMLTAVIDRHRAIAPVKGRYRDGEDLLHCAARALLQAEHPAGCQAIRAIGQDCAPNLLSHVIRAHRLTDDPAAFYDHVAPLIEATKRGTKKRAKAALDAVAALLSSRSTDASNHFVPPMGWDPRWLDLAIAQQRLDLVSDLARPGHTEAIEWLRHRLAKAPGKDLPTVIRGLIRAAVDDIVTVYCDALRREIANQHHNWWVWWELIHLIPHLPPSAVEALEQIAIDLPDNASHLLFDLMQPLRQARDQA